MKFTLFEKKQIGLEITDSFVYAIVLSRGEVVSFSKRGLPDKLIVNGRIQNQELLIIELKAFLKTLKVKDLEEHDFVFGIPERQVFVHIFDMEEEGDLDVLVNKEISKIIPLSRDNICYAYSLSKEVVKSGKRKIVSVSSEKKVLLEWKGVIRKIGFSNITFLAPTLSFFDGLKINKVILPTCTLDVTKTDTVFTIQDKNGVFFVSSLPNNQSVEIERKELLNEIKKGIELYQKERGEEVKNLILVERTGESSDLVEFLNKNISVSVSIGELSKTVSNLDISYTVALGLALSKGKGLVFQHGFDVEDKENKEEEKKEKDSVSFYDKSYYSEDENDLKVRKQKRLLFGILIFGAIALGGAYWYRDLEDLKHKEDILAQTKNFSFVSEFVFEIPIDTAFSEKSSGGVKGRLIENQVEIIGAENEAVQVSRISVNKNLAKDESLWINPVSISLVSGDQAKTIEGEILKYKITWLVYDEISANLLLKNKTDAKINLPDDSYSISNIEKVGVEKTANDNIYTLRVNVSVSADQDIDSD